MKTSNHLESCSRRVIAAVNQLHVREKFIEETPIRFKYLILPLH